MNIGLNIGAGGDSRFPDEINLHWLNMDARNIPGIDIVGDCRRLNFADGSIHKIISVHMLEHIARLEVVPMLKDWYRVLVPGGTFEVEVPNFDGTVREYIKAVDENDIKKEDQRIENVYGRQFFTGDAHCIDPNSDITMSDFSKKKALKLKIGDDLLGFDEYPKTKGKSRRIVKSKLLNMTYSEKPCYKIYLKNGVELISSFKHEWLIKNKNIDWRETCGIFIRNKMLELSDGIKLKPVGIKHIEHIGLHKVLLTETSTNTLFVNNIASHNCWGYNFRRMKKLLESVGFHNVIELYNYSNHIKEEPCLRVIATK
jgi:hypothetical protein